MWQPIAKDYELEEHEHLLLREACRVADRLDRLAEESAGESLTVTNFKGDQVANPTLVEARQQEIVFARLLAALRLPVGDADDPTRPQRRGAPRGVYSRSGTVR
jgi:hypothetical protein